ncbi:hypothetical protein QG070_03885 [Kingella kingae]|uniref:hypothetical protein n=1 Tax=Kingella kingae TaxID=504 RepID=UPI0004047D81|nr:hypothetical protein [Kingella kingae]MDK4586083.1 hypothetical protein [Kingella kingae]MDK4604134.1 hypothetical protein [Kingella kingae]MDK4614126.1 hypothetical protein [Kingella kingae]MDK4618207.1 hypothetical protein [Kingella kingae]MDK4629578.1 hypothetical protein [Kingella kingae]
MAILNIALPIFLLMALGFASLRFGFFAHAQIALHARIAAGICHWLLIKRAPKMSA